MGYTKQVSIFAMSIISWAVFMPEINWIILLLNLVWSAVFQLNGCFTSILNNLVS